MSKIKAFHFHNGNGGGVLSVIKNLLKYSRNNNLENHVIFTINKDLVSDYKMPVLEGAHTQQVFYYSAKWNFYHTCNKLAKLLPDCEALIIAHDWLELGMVSNLGLQNPAVQILHGNYDYYYNLSLKNQNVIDEFICVSPVIEKKLMKILSDKKVDSVQYCRFPVPDAYSINKQNEKLKIVYASGNLDDDNKQFSIIPQINNLLKEKGVEVEWIIVGKGKTKSEVFDLMNSNYGILHFDHLQNDDLLKILATADIFILPSLQEGFPVAVVEAMKAGLVPIITNWEGATEELVIDGETGFYIEPGNALAYAEKIQRLNLDRELLKIIGLAARLKAKEQFDPFQNTKIIEEVLLKSYYSPRFKKQAFKIYGSRLDAKWINNSISKLLRIFTK